MNAIPTHRLGEICQVLKGRNRIAKADDTDPDFRVIQASDVGSRLRSFDELDQSTRRKRSSVEVLPGDIVGSVSGPYGRWVIVPDGYGPALASDHTVVLRKRDRVSMGYLLGFLRSPPGKELISGTVSGSVIRRISPSALEDILVPSCPLDADHVDRVVKEFEDELYRIDTELNELRSNLDQVYQSSASAEVVARLDALQGISASVRTMTDLSNPLLTAKSSFPYPIARTLRVMERSLSPGSRYREIVHEGLETLSITLVSLCAAIARKEGIIGGPETSGWLSAVLRGRATIGSQQHLAFRVAAKISAPGAAYDIGGLGRALGSTDSPAVVLLKKLLKERNRTHGDHPRTDFQFQQRLPESEENMQQLLVALSFLARWKLMYAESVEPVDSGDGTPHFSGTFRILRGDNPDWDLAQKVEPTPLYRGRIYALIDNEALIDLHPYLLVRDCPQCGAKEVYHPNRFDDAEAHLVSIDRGHPQVTTDPALLSDLAAAFTT